MHRFAVIIPVSPHEPALPHVLQQLKHAQWEGQMVLSGQQPPENLPDTVIWVNSKGGRAASMNAAVAACDAEYLWFVHADSSISAAHIRAVQNFSQFHPRALGYFDLRFDDGPKIMRLNEWGVWLRCRVFHAPFGDQGLCISRCQFEQMGGYVEDTPYGEDHLLVLKAAENAIPIRPMGVKMGTSARKYMQGGWWATTWRHVRLWWKQRRAQKVRS